MARKPNTAQDASAQEISEIDLERQVLERLRVFASENAKGLALIWHWGGLYHGDGAAAIMAKAAGLPEPHTTVRVGEPRYREAKICADLSRQVMERDEYRCITCRTHLDLTCDHIHPESKGGETTFENLQTMCRPCNSKKGARL